MPRRVRPVASVYDSLREINILYRNSSVKQWNRLIKALKKEIVKEAKKSR